MKISGDAPEDTKKIFEREYALIPEDNRNIIEQQIQKVKVAFDGNSRFDRTKGILHLDSVLDEEEAIHEMAHALESGANIWDYPKFMKALKDTLGEINPMWDILEDSGTFVRTIDRLADTEKLVSIYQGRIYSEEVPLVDEKMGFNWYSSGDYFAEAYREYLMNPDNLQRKQPLIFEYIKELE